MEINEQQTIKKKSLKKFTEDWKAIQKQITDFGFEHQSVIWGIETRFSNSEKGGFRLDVDLQRDGQAINEQYEYDI